MNALDMAVSKMVIEEDISKRVAKFENGGCDPDHKTQPSQSFKDAMKTELMMGLQKVTMNMARPDCAASIQKRWRKTCASQLQRRKKWLLGSSFDVNSDESWKLQTKCPKASSSSQGVKRPFAEVIKELGDVPINKKSIFEVCEEILKEEEEHESQIQCGQ